MEENGHFVDAGSVPITWTKGLLILMYHLIESPPLRHHRRGLYVEPQKLCSQLQQLRQTGVTFTSLSEWMGQPDTEQRQVAVTFDDAFQNIVVHALPVLQQEAVPAITYVVTDGIGRTNFWDVAEGSQVRPLMDHAEIRRWLDAGQEIGSHGVSHRDLTLLPPDEARREIFDSKKILEDFFGSAIRHFCYPYGKWNPRLRELVGEAGYETACTTDGGINPDNRDPLALRRLLARHRRPYAVALRHAARNCFFPAFASPRRTVKMSS